MRLPVAAGALLVLLALPLGAAASTWEATFPPAAVSAWTGDEPTIVVGAGQPTADLAAAEAALIAALRASNQARPVMDDGALIDFAALDDAAIVARCQGLPVTRVAVIRVFPGAGAAPPTAVITVYDLDGKVRDAFSAERGVPVAGAGGAAAGGGAGKGASRAAFETIDQIGEDRKATTEKELRAQDEFDAKRIYFANHGELRGDTVVATWTTPYQGQFRRPLEGAEFYEALERPDLASAYRRNGLIRTGLTLGGLGLVAGGAAVFVADLSAGECDPGLPGYGACQKDADDQSSTRQVLAFSLIGGGAASLVAALLWPTHPIDAAEAHRLTDEYNRNLKSRLGLQARAPSRPTFEAGLGAVGGGTGLTVRGSLP